LFRRLQIADPRLIQLREWSRLAEELQQERVRLSNRLYSQLWRYYPQMLELGGDDIAADWLLALWDEAPTPAKAAEISTQVIASLFKAHRIRRFEAAPLATGRPPLYPQATIPHRSRSFILPMAT